MEGIQKKQESKWMDIAEASNCFSSFTLQNIKFWNEFPLKLKIQSIEEFGSLIDSSSLEEDIVAISEISFINQIQHRNPTIVKLTLQNLISYTHKHTNLNYNVPHVVNSLISKVMIRKEFRENTLQLILLIFSKCRDGLNIGIQEIFSQTSPKPICEAIFLFELLVEKQSREAGMKEFMKSYLHQIFEFSSYQYQEVRSAALKLFVILIKQYGEQFVTPYKSKLKSNQIDFINKSIPKDLDIIKKSEKIEVPQKIGEGMSKQANPALQSLKVMEIESISKASVSKKQPEKGGSLNVSSSSSTYKKPLPQSGKIEKKQIQALAEVKEKSNIKQPVASGSGVPTSKISKVESTGKKHKEKPCSGGNDLSKSKLSTNSKKKLSDTASAAENDSSSELSIINELKVTKNLSRDVSIDSEAKKKAFQHKIKKTNLSEILEKGGADDKVRKSKGFKEIKVGPNQDKKEKSISSSRKNSFSNIHLGVSKLFPEKKIKDESLKQKTKKKEEVPPDQNQSRNGIHRKLSEGQLKSISPLIKPLEHSVKGIKKAGEADKRKNFLKGEDFQDKVQIKSIKNKQTPTGVDEDNFYLKPKEEGEESEEYNNCFLKELEEVDSAAKEVEEEQKEIEHEETPFGIDNNCFYIVPKTDPSQDGQSNSARSEEEETNNAVNENNMIPNENFLTPNDNYMIPNENYLEPNENFIEPNDNSIETNDNQIVPNGNYMIPHEDEDSQNVSQVEEYNVNHQGNEQIEQQIEQLNQENIQTDKGVDGETFYQKPNENLDEGDESQPQKDQVGGFDCSEIHKIDEASDQLWDEEEQYAKPYLVRNEQNNKDYSQEFQNFKQELNQDENNQEKKYEVRGYFYKQDLVDILEVVENVENEGYFFTQNNCLEKKEDIRMPSLEKGHIKKKIIGTGRVKDEEKEYGNSILKSYSSNQSKSNGTFFMTEQILKAFISVFDNQLIEKLTQEQKERIIYTTNKDQINKWFNQEKYDSVGVISFFILYVGSQFQKDDVWLLSRYWKFQKFLGFNNAMIQSQTISIMFTYFKAIQKHPQIAKRIKFQSLKEIIIKLIKAIPVLRDKLFDQAFAFIDFIFELDIYNDLIFEAISEVLDSNVPKQTVSSLRILSQFLRLYGGKRLQFLRPFMHVIKTISFSANLQVRNTAIEFYQEAYSWMGDSIFEHTKQLKKSQLMQLEDAFSQVNQKERRPLKCPEDIFTPIMDNHLFQAQENIFSSQCDEQTQKLEDFIRKALAVQEWVNKDDLVDKIVNDALSESKLKEGQYIDLVKILSELLDDKSKYLIENSLTLIKSLAYTLKKDFGSSCISLFEKIFDLYISKKQISKDKITKALRSLLFVISIQNVIPVIERLIKKGKYIRELFIVLKNGIKKNDKIDSIVLLIKELQGFLRDKDSYIKVAAYDFFGKVKLLFGLPIIEENLNAEFKNNKFIFQKIQECCEKNEKIQMLTSQKRKMNEQIRLNKTLSLNSEMSTASIDRQYFQIQLQNCKSPKQSYPPIQQFKIQKKNELKIMQSREFEDSQLLSGSKSYFNSLSQFSHIEEPEEIDEI